MRIDGQHHRTIWVGEDGRTRAASSTRRCLPHELRVVELRDLEAAAVAIETMQVRGAPLIGATAAYGVCLALLEDPSDEGLERAHARLIRTRPTAVNLRWALDRMMRARCATGPASGGSSSPTPRPQRICDEDVAICRSIGEHGLALVRDAAARKRPGEPVNILTHCNAGWLATIDWGTATAPIYLAQEAGIPVHVWVDETRPRNQGAALTAFELLHQEVPHTVIVDNVGGHLMQHGHGRPVHRRHRPDDAQRATSPTRSAPTSRRWRPRTTACRSTWRCRRPRSTGRSRDGMARSRSSSAAAEEVTRAARPDGGRADRDRPRDARGLARRQLGVRRDARHGW